MYRDGIVLRASKMSDLESLGKTLYWIAFGPGYIGTFLVETFHRRCRTVLLSPLKVRDTIKLSSDP